MVLHGWVLNKELTENAKEYNPLWIKVLDIQALEKEGSGYFPKHERGFQCPCSDDHNFMHKNTSWCNYLDPYCATHLDKKKKELSF